MTCRYSRIDRAPFGAIGKAEGTVFDIHAGHYGTVIEKQRSADAKTRIRRIGPGRSLERKVKQLTILYCIFHTAIISL